MNVSRIKLIQSLKNLGVAGGSRPFGKVASSRGLSFAVEVAGWLSGACGGDWGGRWAVGGVLTVAWGGRGMARLMCIKLSNVLPLLSAPSVFLLPFFSEMLLMVCSESLPLLPAAI